MTKHLFIGGLVAVGFDRTGSWLLTVSHSGRGVFSTSSWERVARDYGLAYPKNCRAAGIGPIEGESVPVSELDSERPIRVTSANGQIVLLCEGSGIEVVSGHK